MNREDLIYKWLNHNLSTEEQKAFEALEDYDSLIRMDSTLKTFKAESYNTKAEYAEVNAKIGRSDKPTINWLNHVLRVAAVVVIGLSIFYYTTTLDTKIDTVVAEQQSVTLPDASSVTLNAVSSLSFKNHDWNDERIVNLRGEAFFKVAKGKTFTVKTSNGEITVLGTEFSVKQRQNYFEVICFEGLVSVTHHSKTVQLRPGDSYNYIDGILTTNQHKAIINKQPNWLSGESSFERVSLHHVVEELENQYAIDIVTNDVDTSRLFTGSFTHKDLDLALKAIIIPMNLRYEHSNNSIIFMRD